MRDQFQKFGLGMSRSEVTLRDHSPLWSQAFHVLKEKLEEVCGSKTKFHHIGSTSISGISAKPILDVLGIAPSVEEIDQIKSNIELLGFVWKGEYGIPGRRYSVLYDPSEQVGFVHLHMFAEDSPEVERHLVFRDYLREHPNSAKAYDETKKMLKAKFRNHREKYTEGKSERIQEFLRQAKIWKNGGHIVRKAEIGDEAEIANVHLNSWREIYEGLLPQKFLDELPLTFSRRLRWWKKSIVEAREVIQVVETREGVVGFSCFGPGRQPDRSNMAELYAIYLLEKYKGKGIGFELLSSGFKRMKEDGFEEAYCWVLDGNPTVQFYEKTGAHAIGETMEVEIGGQKVTELMYVWTNLEKF